MIGAFIKMDGQEGTMLSNHLSAAAIFFVATASFCGSAFAADPKEIATTVCATCHGEGGNSVTPIFPKLAGQNAKYLEKQLEEFLNGKRKSEVMQPFFSSFTKSDIRGLAAYFAAQTQSDGIVEDKSLLEAGKKMYDDGNTESGVPGCGGCHEADGKGSDRYPRLAGQHQAYTQQEMVDFKTGSRTNDKGRVMRVVTERMTEQEMKAVSEYIASLR